MLVLKIGEGNMNNATPFYFDSKSILLVNHNGKMRQLFVPFSVQSLHKTSAFPKNAWLYVEEVKPDPKYRLLYCITDLWYPYYHFKLSLNF